MVNRGLDFLIFPDSGHNFFGQLQFDFVIKKFLAK